MVSAEEEKTRVEHVVSLVLSPPPSVFQYSARCHVSPAMRIVYGTNHRPMLRYDRIR